MAQTLQHSSYHHVRTSQHLVIAIILLCGLFLRIHYVDWNHDRMNAVIHTRLAGDEIGYDRCVRQLLTTGIYGYVPYGSSKVPNAFTTPGYPLFLAACYRLFGYKGNTPIVAIQATQVVLDLAAGIFLYLSGLKLYEKRWVANVPVLIYLVYPSFVLMPGYLLTESLFGFFSMVFLHTLVSFFLEQREGYALASGLIFGALILVRPAAFPFIILLAPLLVYMARRNRIPPRAGGLLILGFLIVMLPWWIRNLITLRKPILLAGQTGNPLLWGTYPYNDAPNIDVNMDPAEMQKIALRRIIEGFRTQPLLYLQWYTVGKTWFLVKDFYTGYLKIHPSMYRLSYDQLRPIHLTLVIAGTLGLLSSLVVSSGHHRGWVWLVLLAFVSFAVYLPFAPTPRYFLGIMPFCFLGIGFLAERASKGWQP